MSLDKIYKYIEANQDGFVEDTGKINVEPLYQIKAWLIKDQLVEVFVINNPSLSLN